MVMFSKLEKFSIAVEFKMICLTFVRYLKDKNYYFCKYNSSTSCDFTGAFYATSLFSPRSRMARKI